MKNTMKEWESYWTPYFTISFLGTLAISALAYVGRQTDFAFVSQPFIVGVAVIWCFFLIAVWFALKMFLLIYRAHLANMIALEEDRRGHEIRVFNAAIESANKIQVNVIRAMGHGAMFDQPSKK